MPRSLNIRNDAFKQTTRPHNRRINDALLYFQGRSSAACPCFFRNGRWNRPHCQQLRVPYLLRLGWSKPARRNAGAPGKLLRVLYPARCRHLYQAVPEHERTRVPVRVHVS